jgi:hypothetical protein
MMQEVATIPFVDRETTDECLAIVRAAPASIAFCLSILRDGDVEVTMGVEDGRRLLDALNEALRLASTG